MKKKNVWTYGPLGATTKNLKEIHAMTLEIINATGGRTNGR